MKLSITKYLKFVLFVFFCLNTSLCFSQDDTINNIKKPEFFDIENKDVSKFRKLYSKFLFKNSKSPTPVYSKPFDSKFQGKPIRKIIINTLDPFGYSIDDSLKQPTKWIEKAGNTLHLKSKPYFIRQQLLFNTNDFVDSIKLKESERLLRAQRNLRRVEISPVFVENSDSVDVYINTLDSWSMIITGSVSTSRYGIRVSERNFLGLGHVFNNRFRHNYTTGKNLYGFNYTVPNIAKTRIIGNINYYKNELEHFNKGISLQRPFYSPLAKLAGGISFGQVYYQDSLDYNRTVLQYHNFKYNYSDIWLAKAFRIFKNRTRNITNFVVSTRFYDRNYKEAPDFASDPHEFFSDQKNYFLGVGISSRHYEKDHYLFNYGIEEDIAVGSEIGIISAIQDRPGYERFYLAGKASAGGYLNSNYLGAQVQFGSFFRSGQAQQTTLNLQSLYFSSLKEWGRWKFRQFSKINYTVGYNRFDTPADELTLNEHDFDGIGGINKARDINGIQKLMFEFQTQSYTPYQVLGFRMAPFFNAALGVIGDRNSSFFSSNNIISRIGLGIMFTNDYFVFNNFQISFSYYPRIPGDGNNLFKTGVIDNKDFKLMDYDFNRPEYIRWNRWD